MLRDAAGEIGFEVLVGGGLGRAPIIGQVIRDFLPLEDLLSYLEAILRVYNRYGRRDNIHKARIKILVKALGIDAVSRGGGGRVAGRARRCAAAAAGRGGARARILHAAAVPDASRTSTSRPDREPEFQGLVPLQHPRAQGAGLSRRVRVAESARASRPAT